MNALNSVILEGNLVRDPELKETVKGTSVCTVAIASNRFYRQDEETEKEVSFFDIETWGKLAEICCDQGSKGRGLRVVGRLKQDRWTNAEGKNVSRIKIIAEHIEFKPLFTQGQRPMSPDSFSHAVQSAQEIAASF